MEPAYKMLLFMKQQGNATDHHEQPAWLLITGNDHGGKLTWPKRSLIPSSLNFTRSVLPLLASSLKNGDIYSKYLFFPIYWWYMLKVYIFLGILEISAPHIFLIYILMKDIHFSWYIDILPIYIFPDILATTPHPWTLPGLGRAPAPSWQMSPIHANPFTNPHHQ